MQQTSRERQRSTAVPGLSETHVTFSPASLYIFRDVYSRPKAAFPFARSEWRQPSYSLTPTTHTGSRRYGPHKLDYSYCITGNSSISQPAEINITFLHITPNISDGISTRRRIFRSFCICGFFEEIKVDLSMRKILSRIFLNIIPEVQHI